jgi:hypothetical protein
MRVLICGDRNWTDRAAIGRYVISLPHDAEDRRAELRAACQES